MRTNAPTQTTGALKALGAALVLVILASLALAVTAPVMVGGGVAWALIAAATVGALVAGVAATFVADRLFFSATVPARAKLDLAA